MDLSFFQDAYRNKKYEEVVSHDAFMRESLNPRFLVILIKSLIHLFGEDDLRVRDNLFLFLYSEKSLSFRGSFTLSIQNKLTKLSEVEAFGNMFSGFLQNIITTTSLDHVIEKYKRCKDSLSYEVTNQEEFLMIIFYSLELYDLEHEEYPMIKWLLNHFYKHD